MCWLEYEWNHKTVTNKNDRWFSDILKHTICNFCSNSRNDTIVFALQVLLYKTQKKQLLLTSHYWFIHNVQMAVTLWWKFSKIDFCCVYHNNKCSQLSSIILNKSFYLARDIYSSSFFDRQGCNIDISKLMKTLQSSLLWLV